MAPTPAAFLAGVNGNFGLLSQRSLLAGAGNYWVATNPTPGTAIAYSLKTGYSATANGLFSLSNSQPTGGRSMYLDRLKLIQTATAPTGTLSMRAEVYAETGIRAITTAALAVTPVNVNSSITDAFPGTCTFFSAGAGTVPAAVGTRSLVGIGEIATGVTVQYDSFTFDFGNDGPPSGKNGGAAARATDPADQVTTMPPVCIPPGNSVFFNLWWVTQAANTPSFEFSLGIVCI